MKIQPYFLTLLLFACAGNEGNTDQNNQANSDKVAVENETADPLEEAEDDFSYEADLIVVGERVDGPANVRNEPNGDLIFELDDNAVIQIVDTDDEWVKISAHCWMDASQYEAATIQSGANLYDQNKRKFGAALASLSPLLMEESEGEGYAYIEGYTHRDNIRPESLIENDLATYIAKNGRNKSAFETFIGRYKLQAESRHLDYDGYFIYENWITDPSPGYRILLLFKDENLKGIYHSRDLELEDATTYDLERANFRVSFFNDYPKADQQEFVDYMRDWLKTVD